MAVERLGKHIESSWQQTCSVGEWSTYFASLSSPRRAQQPHPCWLHRELEQEQEQELALAAVLRPQVRCLLGQRPASQARAPWLERAREPSQSLPAQ
jgi:hypothetical protein